MIDTKFSIVVPTMWKFPPFLDFIRDLTKSELVGEILIINNNFQETPNHSVLNDTKVRLFNFPSNTFVNPAWNFGVDNSNYNNICILSDDVIFDLKVFDRVAEKLKQGVLIVNVLEPVETNPIIQGTAQILPFQQGMSLFHFGALMFMCKEDWLYIPNGLDLYYGDYWIWETMLGRFNQNYVINDLFFYTPGSVTCNLLPGRQDIYDRESIIYSKAIRYLKNKYPDIYQNNEFL